VRVTVIATRFGSKESGREAEKSDGKTLDLQAYLEQQADKAGSRRLREASLSEGFAASEGRKTFVDDPNLLDVPAFLRRAR